LTRELRFLSATRSNRSEVQARVGHRRDRTALVAALSLCTLGASTGASAADGVVWQGSTPKNGTARVAGVGKELRITLEAAGPAGSLVRIWVSRMPRGARLERVGDEPARTIFRWRPTRSQLGEWTLVFNATSQSAFARSISIRLHVGRRATRSFRLSSVRGRSQSATLLHGIAARARPHRSARVVARLRALTPEHVPHVVYLLGGRIDRQGRYWLRVRLPILPNGSSGWIPRGAVGSFASLTTHLVIDRGRLRATLYRRGQPVFRSIIGVGLPRWPTPPGRFYIRERLTGFTDPIYGLLAFGTNARSPVLTDWPGGGFVGIHGTNQPEILPGRVSHGCIRLRNEDIRRLARLMPVGTPVTVR
jgi:L,D-transpeptidase catalytic domain